VNAYIEFRYETGPEAGTYQLIGPFSSVPAAEQHKNTYGPIKGQVKLIDIITALDASSRRQPETAEEWASFVLSLKDQAIAEWGHEDRYGNTRSKHHKAAISIEMYRKYKKMSEQLKESWTDWTPEQKEITRLAFKEVGEFILTEGLGIDPEEAQEVANDH
jgi:hypothetical protein